MPIRALVHHTIDAQVCLLTALAVSRFDFVLKNCRDARELAMSGNSCTCPVTHGPSREQNVRRYGQRRDEGRPSRSRSVKPNMTQGHRIPIQFASIDCRHCQVNCSPVVIECSPQQSFWHIFLGVRSVYSNIIRHQMRFSLLGSTFMILVPGFLPLYGKGYDRPVKHAIARAVRGKLRLPRESRS